MQWYYAIDGQRFGPVSEAEFARLVAVGTVAADTLVWRQGLDAWAPWSTLAATTILPPVTGDLSVPLLPNDGVGANAGTSGPGVGASADDLTPSERTTSWTADEFAAHLRSNGYATSVGGCLSRAWECAKSPSYFTAIAVAALGWIVMVAAGMVPIVGMLSGILVSPHITAGLQWYFLQRARGNVVGFETMFEGFSQRYGKLALLGLLQFAVTLVIVGLIVGMLLGFGVSLAEIEAGKPPHFTGSQAGIMVGTIFFTTLVAVFFGIRFSLAHIVAMDRDDGVIDAYRLSWRITGLRFWTLLGLMILLGLLSIAGLLALMIGLLVVMPLLSAVLAQAYEDACNSAAGNPAE